MEKNSRSERLNARQLRFIQAFTNPAPDASTFHNAAQSAITAGYSQKKARERGYRLLRLEKVRTAIRTREERLREILELDQAEYARKLLAQMDAWLADDGKPKREPKRHFHQGDLVHTDLREWRPDGANVKAAELLGTVLGLIPEKRSSQDTQPVYVVAMPPKAQSVEEWMQRYGEALGVPGVRHDLLLPSGREIDAPEGREHRRAPPGKPTVDQRPN